MEEFDVSEIVFYNFHSNDNSIEIFDNVIHIVEFKDYYEIMGLNAHKSLIIPSPVATQFIIKNYDMTGEQCPIITHRQVANLFLKILYKDCIIKDTYFKYYKNNFCVENCVVV